MLKGPQRLMEHAHFIKNSQCPIQNFLSVERSKASDGTCSFDQKILTSSHNHLVSVLKCYVSANICFLDILLSGETEVSPDTTSKT